LGGEGEVQRDLRYNPKSSWLSILLGFHVGTSTYCWPRNSSTFTISKTGSEVACVTLFGFTFCRRGLVGDVSAATSGRRVSDSLSGVGQTTTCFWREGFGRVAKRRLVHFDLLHGSTNCIQ
jgi:hypothetical protein